jgi:hypothetical protein
MSNSLTPVERLKKFRDKVKSENLSLALDERTAIIDQIETRRELIRQSIDAEHVENQANYIMQAHEILGSHKPSMETLEVYMAACKKLDELKKGVFNEQQAGDRTPALQFNVQNVASLDPSASPQVEVSQQG